MQAEPVVEFWRGLGDVDLDALVDQAIESNADLRIAGPYLVETRTLNRLLDDLHLLDEIFGLT
jgi:hypothetical protein